MKNNRDAFEFNDNDIVPGEDYTTITTHMVFDVKLGTLTRKARLCADGHKMPTLPKESTYSSVPSRYSARILFLLAALNWLYILSADIQNAYLTVPLIEKYYTIVRLEDGFSPHLAGRICKIVRALYGLPIAGASFRAYLTKDLRSLGYVSCKADPDVHMRRVVKEDGTEYWEYLIAYVDDLLCCGTNPQHQLETIEKRFKLKDGTIGEPTLYLGADIGKHVVEDGTFSWSLSSSNHTAKAVKAVEDKIVTEKYGFKRLPNGTKTPLTGDYRPKIDASQELDAKQQNYYQGLIGVLR